MSTTPDIGSLRVHCLLHTYQLAQDVRKWRQINAETQSFAKLLREKEQVLKDKERNQKTNIDLDSLAQDTETEKHRWERNWTAIKGEWVLDTLRTTLSPSSSTNFFSQSYIDAFANHTPSSTHQPTQTAIQLSSNLTEESIAKSVAAEQELSAEITRLESFLGHNTPPRRSSIRKSMPLTLPTPSPSPEKTRMNGYNLRFSRSMSRLSRSASESPKSRRMLAPEHGINKQ
jgi:hypothetical protein